MMRQRCNNESLPHYNRYGAAGVKICPEWDDFTVFREWAMQHGYADGLSIDRINNDLGYSPDNCRWATAQTQAENRRFVHRAPDGTPWSAIAKAHGLKVTTMHCRINEGWPIEKAATLPLGSRWRQSA